jgi:cytochrome c biogenesis protein CcmG/thiol:disulfide interchange protein DsbE
MEKRSMTEQPDIPPKTARKWLAFAPLGLFVALAAVFLIQLESGKDNSVIPSALVGKPAPRVALEPLQGSGRPGFDPALLDGGVTLVNVFASWCVPCRDEHPVLMGMAGDPRFQIIGHNYKDKPENAVGFLSELGNPYDRIGVDPDGRAGIEWGVYGVPETFIVGPDGIILGKHVGPLTPDVVRAEIMPMVDKALAESLQKKTP